MPQFHIMSLVCVHFAGDVKLGDAVATVEKMMNGIWETFKIEHSKPMIMPMYTGRGMTRKFDGKIVVNCETRDLYNIMMGNGPDGKPIYGTAVNENWKLPFVYDPQLNGVECKCPLFEEDFDVSVISINEQKKIERETKEKLSNLKLDKKQLKVEVDKKISEMWNLRKIERLMKWIEDVIDQVTDDVWLSRFLQLNKEYQRMSNFLDLEDLNNENETSGEVYLKEYLDGVDTIIAAWDFIDELTTELKEKLSTVYRCQIPSFEYPFGVVKVVDYEPSKPWDGEDPYRFTCVGLPKYLQNEKMMDFIISQFFEKKCYAFKIHEINGTTNHWSLQIFLDRNWANILDSRRMVTFMYNFSSEYLRLQKPYAIGLVPKEEVVSRICYVHEKK